MTVTCEDCGTKNEVPDPAFDIINRPNASLVLWVHPVVNCHCGSRYIGAFVSLQPALTYVKVPPENKIIDPTANQGKIIIPN